jgi:hypothetical protein
MASDSLITDFPAGYRDDIDAANWINHLTLMIDNLRTGVPQTYSLVGSDLDAFQVNKEAFRYLASYNGVTFTLERTRQVISLRGLAAIDNVDMLNPADTPDFFFDLKQGSVAIPMDASEDSISDDYDAGYPIWVAPLTITSFKP